MVIVIREIKNAAELARKEKGWFADIAAQARELLERAQKGDPKAQKMIDRVRAGTQAGEPKSVRAVTYLEKERSKQVGSRTAAQQVTPDSDAPGYAAAAAFHY